MKGLSWIICFVVICCSPEQVDDKEFETTFDAYATAFNNDQYDEFMSFLPIQTFEKVSKEEFIQYYKDIELAIGKSRIRDYEFVERGPILTKGDSTFRKMRYKSTIVNFNNKDSVNKSAIRYLAKLYGVENIEYDSSERLLVIDQVKDLIFMKAKGHNWTFLEYDSTKANSLTKRLVPSDILSKL